MGCNQDGLGLLPDGQLWKTCCAICEAGVDVLKRKSCDFPFTSNSRRFTCQNQSKPHPRSQAQLLVQREVGVTCRPHPYTQDVDPLGPCTTDSPCLWALPAQASSTLTELVCGLRSLQNTKAHDYHGPDTHPCPRFHSKHKGPTTNYLSGVHGIYCTYINLYNLYTPRVHHLTHLQINSCLMNPYM